MCPTQASGQLRQGHRCRREAYLESQPAGGASRMVKDSLLRLLAQVQGPTQDAEAVLLLPSRQWVHTGARRCSNLEDTSGDKPEPTPPSAADRAQRGCGGDQGGCQQTLASARAVPRLSKAPVSPRLSELKGAAGPRVHSPPAPRRQHTKRPSVHHVPCSLTCPCGHPPG